MRVALLSSFLMHYDHVMKLLSFMMHRTDNKIESIWVTSSSFSEERVLVHVADNDKNSSDDGLLPIAFSELEGKVGALLELFYNSTEDKPSYSLDFIPRNNTERWTITNDTVRSVFSALECEYNSNNCIKKPQEKALQELRKTVKNAIREYRKANKGKNELSNETYNSISSDIDNWAMPAKERIMAMVEEYEAAMKAFLEGKIKVTDKEVQAFVKYRNSITHGNYKKITPDIQKTTRAMKALVYCSLLQRIGVTKEKIIEICHKLRF